MPWFAEKASFSSLCDRSSELDRLGTLSPIHAFRSASSTRADAERSLRSRAVCQVEAEPRTLAYSGTPAACSSYGVESGEVVACRRFGKLCTCFSTTSDVVFEHTTVQFHSRFLLLRARHFQLPSVQESRHSAADTSSLARCAGQLKARAVHYSARAVRALNELSGEKNCGLSCSFLSSNRLSSPLPLYVEVCSTHSCVERGGTRAFNEAADAKTSPPRPAPLSAPFEKTSPSNPSSKVRRPEGGLHTIESIKSGWLRCRSEGRLKIGEKRSEWIDPSFPPRTFSTVSEGQPFSMSRESSF
jgi:hypothetical protein